MQTLNAETQYLPRRTEVQSWSTAQLNQMTDRDLEKLKKEYAELLGCAQARIMEVLCVDRWPIGKQIELSEYQVERLVDPFRQWDAAEYELIRVSQALEPALW